MGWDPETVLDPQDPATFHASKLDWTELVGGRHAVVLDMYRELVELRRQLPALTDPDLTQVRCEADEERRTLVMRRGEVVVAVNFGAQAVEVAMTGQHELRWTTPAGATLDRGRLALPAHAGALLTSRA